jgi:glyoxylate reductase
MMPRRIVITRELGTRVSDALGALGDVWVNPWERVLTADELAQACRGSSAVVATGLDGIDDRVLDAAGPTLRVVANVAAGYENIDVAAANRRSVVVTNTPEVLTEATADMAFALILATARRVVEADRFVRSGTPWRRAPTWMLGQQVAGSTLGIIGLGRIGQAVARRATGFGMRVLYANPRPVAGELQAALGAAPRRLPALLEESDFVSLHCPLSAETHHLIGPDELRQMKPTAILVNTARGAVVDESALAKALHERTIAGAGLDVFEDEPLVRPALVDCDRAVLVPHLGSATVSTRASMAKLAMDNVVAVLSGRPPLTPVPASELRPYGERC